MLTYIDALLWRRTHELRFRACIHAMVEAAAAPLSAFERLRPCLNAPGYRSWSGTWAEYTAAGVYERSYQVMVERQHVSFILNVIRPDAKERRYRTRMIIHNQWGRKWTCVHGYGMTWVDVKALSVCLDRITARYANAPADAPAAHKRAAPVAK